MDLILFLVGFLCGVLTAFNLTDYIRKRERQKLKQESILKEAKQILENK